MGIRDGDTGAVAAAILSGVPGEGVAAAAGKAADALKANVLKNIAESQAARDASGFEGLVGAEKAINQGNIVIDSKIGLQMSERGWTKQQIQTAINGGATGSTMDMRSAAKTPDGVPRNDSATVYGTKNSYIVINDRTGEVVQVSDRTDSSWIPDSRIKWN